MALYHCQPLLTALACPPFPPTSSLHIDYSECRVLFVKCFVISTSRKVTICNTFTAEHPLFGVMQVVFHSYCKRQRLSKHLAANHNKNTYCICLPTCIFQRQSWNSTLPWIIHWRYLYFPILYFFLFFVIVSFILLKMLQYIKLIWLNKGLSSYFLKHWYKHAYLTASRMLQKVSVFDQYYLDWRGSSMSSPCICMLKNIKINITCGFCKHCSQNFALFLSFFISLFPCLLICT